jgi:hypothetical protein
MAEEAIGSCWSWLHLDKMAVHDRMRYVGLPSSSFARHRLNPFYSPNVNFLKTKKISL